MVLRDVVNDGLAAMICVWTGYFLRHDFNTASKPRVAMLVLAGLAAVGGVIAAHRMKSRKVMAVMGAAALALTAAAYPYALVPAAVLVVASIIKSNRAVEASPTESALLQFIIAASALAMGLTAISPGMVFEADLNAYLLAIPLAVYIAVAEIPRIAKSMASAQVTAIMWSIVVLAGAGAFAAISHDAEYSVITALLLGYLAVRVLMYGWMSNKKITQNEQMNYIAREENIVNEEQAERTRLDTKDELRIFAQNLIAGSGILAGALMAVRIPEGQRAVAELAWPIIAAAVSIVWIRMSPYLMRLRD